MREALPPFPHIVGRQPRLLKTLVRFGRQKPLGAMGGIVLVALVVVAIIASWVAPLDP